MIDLPDTPGPADSEWHPLDFGSTRVPPLGGAVQRINRNGNRYAIQVQLPSLSLSDALRWRARLTSAVREGARWKIRQVGLPIASFGDVRVAGAEQTGMFLTVDGGTAGAPWALGQFVNLIVGGQRYLHQMAEPGAFAADGTATLPLVEPLRVVPGDNDVIDWAPRIEGFVPQESAVMRIGSDRRGYGGFYIEEMG
ncbi:hypothetical protein FHR22_002625 [Sphingopyxis panaciterrae]|uniref:hypothetical protein n=1 Tax=Sphingopyxis panaciterrae TaxID=363841 RepID=UPI00141E09F2|nr:hypothetical protein [Sphingopyxis panaciterrae]NIJ37922.1 hypothetical protein [Sphingopyxis panaciterrae]